VQGPEGATTGSAVGLRRWGLAWLGASLALVLHMIDEIAHEFLKFYNPAVLSVRAKIPWLPLPTLEFAEWVAVLGAALLILALLTPWAFRGAPWMRPVSWTLAILFGTNGLLHFAAALTLKAMIPGVLTAPILLVAAFCLAGCIPKRQALEPAG
jgi:hypothetical protein